MKKLGQLFILITLVSFSYEAHALKFRKCVDKSFKTASIDSKPPKTWNEFLGATFVQTWFSSSTSSTSFTSSTGECGAFALFKVRENFIAESFDHVRQESAQGGGEHLAAVAALSGCNSDAAQARFQNSMQSQFQKIYYPSGAPILSQDLGRQVDGLIQGDSTLRGMCQFEG
jgi:hypothetical protein